MVCVSHAALIHKREKEDDKMSYDAPEHDQMAITRIIVRTSAGTRTIIRVRMVIGGGVMI